MTDSRVLEKRGLYGFGDAPIGDRVFWILEREHVALLQLPVDDDRFGAFICLVEDIPFVFINSHLSLGLQIFAAAHELYHFWFDLPGLRSGEFESPICDVTATDEERLDLNERLANRFAAEFLVPSHALTLSLEQLSSDAKVDLGHILRLADYYQVPYRTMVKRLNEEKRISNEECRRYLAFDESDPNGEVRLGRRRIGLNDCLDQRTNVRRLPSWFIDDALSNYRDSKITYGKLAQLLKIAEVGPIDFGITDPRDSVERA